MRELVTSPICPSCGSGESRQFYEVPDVPVHQVKLVRSREEAVRCAKGDIALRFCTSCGFVWNAAFDPHLMRYEEDYESTQTVSPTFNRFHERLAHQLIERFDLRGKEVVEVGCGQGEFITMLAEIGDNRGYGFDAVHRGEGKSERVTFIKDFYGPRYRHLQPALVCCKMTLEHVHDTGQFLGMLQETLGDRRDVVVFFMIPEVTRILDLRAFWDIYYEHSSYFSPRALAHLFRQTGFDPIDVWCDYGNQYVLIAARPGTGTATPLDAEQPPEVLSAKIDRFAASVRVDQARWKGWVAELRRQGQKTVLWGGGSKGVSFLTTLKITDDIDYVVDINRNRSGTYIAGAGQQIMPPEFLKEYRPDVVIVMSPIYWDEIKAKLDEIGVHPGRLISIESPEELPASG